MKKIVLDTSALIDDVSAWKHFPESEVILSIATINELDQLKKQFNDTGKAARVCIRLLDKISDLGDISVGILLENNVLLRVDTKYYDVESDPRFFGFGAPDYGDTQILACAYSLHLENLNDDIILISNDINLRIKAKSRGIFAEAHKEISIISELYLGYKTIQNPDLFSKFQTDEKLFVSEVPVELGINECVSIEAEEAEILGRKISDKKIKLVKKNSLWGIFPRSKEQAFAMDLIMDKQIDLLTLTGLAGSGKSIVVLASALELVLSKKQYNKLIIYRPIQSVGAELGYIPGTIEEKLAPHFQAVMDSLEFLLGGKNQHWKKDLELWMKKGMIEFGAMTFIRGRSINNAIIFIDECQNINAQDIKTILTRAGEGTKIIMSGDIEQIDRNDLDASNNGLMYVINKFKGSEIAGHITFTQGERSRLATLAAKIL